MVGFHSRPPHKLATAVQHSKVQMYARSGSGEIRTAALAGLGTGLQPLPLWLTLWEETVLPDEVRASSRSRLLLRIDNSNRRPSVAALP